LEACHRKKKGETEQLESPSPNSITPFYMAKSLLEVTPRTPVTCEQSQKKYTVKQPKYTNQIPRHRRAAFAPPKHRRPN
jgi:hypothetical protein